MVEIFGVVDGPTFDDEVVEDVTDLVVTGVADTAFVVEAVVEAVVLTVEVVEILLELVVEVTMLEDVVLVVVEVNGLPGPTLQRDS